MYKNLLEEKKKGGRANLALSLPRESKEIVGGSHELEKKGETGEGPSGVLEDSAFPGQKGIAQAKRDSTGNLVISATRP